MNIIEVPVDKLIPYENNPRIISEEAVDVVAASIEAFDFQQPIVIDKNYVVIAGHTRLKAAKQLGLETVPCKIADELNDAEAAAYRLADNKTGEFSKWDFEKLPFETQKLETFKMEQFGFEKYKTEDEEIEEKRREFETRMENGEKLDEDEEYLEFLEKFKAKKTTDDCYTPENVYNAVAEWVEKEYGVKRNNFVRPFYPLGDYQKENYPDNCIVVDNPPFSILAQIIKFYSERNIKFFLFCPALTAFSSSSSSCACCICTGNDITYENGASINTSFVTNLEELRCRSCPELYKAVDSANKANLATMKRSLPKYSYPDYVITAAKLNYYSIHGVDFSVSVADSYKIGELDEQKAQGKSIFGNGYLLSEKAAAEKAAAEKAAAEKAAAEKAAAEKAAAEKWNLSEREWEIVHSLGT